MIKKRLLWLLGIVVLVITILLSYRTGAKANITSDFNVFWQAGVNYHAGFSLYHEIGGARRYIYPPFAAMLFRGFAVFSLKTAAILYCFVNFLMWAGIFYYTYKLLQLCKVSKQHIRISLGAGFILSIRYFFYHVGFMQMNELVLLMSLIAVKALLEKKHTLAIGLLVAATFIKIIPVFLLIWALSKCKLKTYFYAAGFTIICIALPLLVRGTDRGILDIKEYYDTFLGPVSAGRVETGIENQGLTSTLYKVFSTTEDGSKYGYIITELPVNTIQLIAKLSTLLLLLLYFAVLLYSKYVYKSISLLEVSIVLLLTLLLTGIAWEYHFVSFGFVFTILIAQYLNATKRQRYAYYPILLFVFLNDIIGGSTVGFTFYYRSCGYGFLTILALVTVLFQTVCFFTKKNNHPKLPTTEVQ